MPLLLEFHQIEETEGDYYDSLPHPKFSFLLDGKFRKPSSQVYFCSSLRPNLLTGGNVFSRKKATDSKQNGDISAILIPLMNLALIHQIISI